MFQEGIYIVAELQALAGCGVPLCPAGPCLRQGQTNDTACLVSLKNNNGAYSGFICHLTLWLSGINDVVVKQAKAILTEFSRLW